MSYKSLFPSSDEDSLAPDSQPSQDNPPVVVSFRPLTRIHWRLTNDPSIKRNNDSQFPSSDEDSLAPDGQHHMLTKVRFSRFRPLTRIHWRLTNTRKQRMFSNQLVSVL